MGYVLCFYYIHVIQVNGSPTKHFRLHKVLKQGNPLSPYLFILVNEVLMFMIMEIRKKNLIRGLPIGSYNIVVSQFYFEDDTLIFLSRHKTSLLNYMRVLDFYGIMSRLRINYTKSELITWKVNDELAIERSKFLGCCVKKLPTKYLGLPLVQIQIDRLRTWEPVIENFEAKLAMWKCKLIS